MKQALGRIISLPTRRASQQEVVVRFLSSYRVHAIASGSMLIWPWLIEDSVARLMLLCLGALYVLLVYQVWDDGKVVEALLSQSDKVNARDE